MSEVRQAPETRTTWILSVGGKVSLGDDPPGGIIPDLPVKCPDLPFRGKFCVTFGKNHATFSENQAFSRRRRTRLFGSLCGVDLVCDQGTMPDEGVGLDIEVSKFSLPGGLIPRSPRKMPGFALPE